MARSRLLVKRSDRLWGLRLRFPVAIRYVVLMEVPVAIGLWGLHIRKGSTGGGHSLRRCAIIGMKFWIQTQKIPDSMLYISN